MRIAGTSLLAVLILWAPVGQTQVVGSELAGNALSGYPHFEYVRAFNEDAPIQVAVDPTQLTGLVGVTADVYLVDAQASWTMGDSLVDAGAGAETRTFSGADITANIVTVAVGGELDSDAGIEIGVPYDVVIDADRDGVLSSGDVLDDGSANEAGLYVVKDLVGGGPLATTCIDYTVTGVTPGFTREVTCYPSAISGLGQVPLVVISHGNGHQYVWYDYLQRHLASHGYVVMSHQNNTGPGIETASTTTLQHTDAFLGQLGTIGGGVFLGHVDSSRITWIGHSRGGEGVARAFDRILDGTFTPANYSLDDIVLISSIAPTDFLGTASANPHDANYHLLYGSADGDVCGCPNNDIADSFNVYERATGFAQSTYVHGADHNDFNCCGFDDFSGPPGTAIGRPEAQRVAKAAYLALVKHYVEGNVPGKDYLWRQYERFKPIGVAASTTVVSEYRPDGNRFVVDDYQTSPSLFSSSSRGLVLSNTTATPVTNRVEGLLNDIDGQFQHNPADPFNGMTRARPSDVTRGTMFDVPSTGPWPFLFWTVPGLDVTQYEYLSFRAAQGTRHPLTTSSLGDYAWFVGLQDGSGGLSFLNFSVYGGGVEEPYQRTGFGAGAGWQNEFETIRIRLGDFVTGSGGAPATLDLTDVQKVWFVFLRSDMSREAARIGLDDVEFTTE